MTAPKGTILVTGANGGLGTAIVKNIIARPDLAAYHGVYTVRDVAAASSLQSALRTAKSHPHDVLPLDLSKQSSVRETAAVINAKVSNGEIPQIRALILNAGYREWPGRTRIEDGLDITFSSNYLGHWLLTLLLLQSMDRESGRVVIVGGWVHDPLDESNKANGAFEDEQWKKIFADASSETVESVAKAAWSPSSDDPSKDRKGLSGIRRYGAAKLCSVMMIFELQRRLDSDPELSGISVLGVDPGIMATHITTMTLGWLVRIIFSVVAQIANWAKPNGIMRQPHKSAGDVLAAALETDPPFGKRPKGMYLNGSDLKEPSVEAKDAAKRATVWKTSIKYTELKEGETCLTDWS